MIRNLARQSNSCFNGFILALVASSLVSAAKPEVKVTSTFLTPRLHMVGGEEETHWRLWASYHQTLGRLVKLQSHFEYGSENYIFQNPFRVHNLSATVTIRKHSLNAGRITLWNRLIHARVDGGEYQLRTERFGSLRFLGGVPAVTDFSDTEVAEKSFFFLSWGKGGPGKNLEVSSWARSETNETAFYTGTTWNARIFSQVKISGSLAWDFTHSVLYHGRLLMSYRWGNHLVRLGARHKRYAVSSPYPWATTRTTGSPTTSLGVTSSLSRETSWWNQLVYRLGDPSVRYFRSILFHRSYHVTLLAGIQGDRTLLGSGLGATRALSRTLRFGGNILVNATGYKDLVELSRATSLYGWIAFRPLSMVMVRLYGVFSKNPYYVNDGRGGLTIRATL
ncbi:MAG: hypothetical protein V3U24_07605 [Candidatus Neomarinimicrobiota bacterium]